MRPGCRARAAVRARPRPRDRPRGPESHAVGRTAALALTPASDPTGAEATSSRSAAGKSGGGQPELGSAAVEQRDTREQSASVRLGEADDSLEHGVQIEPGGDLLEQPALPLAIAWARVRLGRVEHRAHHPNGVARLVADDRRPVAHLRVAAVRRRKRYSSVHSAAPRAIASCMPLRTRSRSSP